MKISSIIDSVSAEITYVSREMDSIIPVSFILAWIRSRCYLDLLAGFPAILAMGILMAGGFYVSTNHQPRGLTEIINDALHAKEKGEQETLEFYLREARYADQRHPDASFTMALLLVELHREKEANEIIRSLAPLSTPGYPPAQNVVIQRLERQCFQIQQSDSPSEEQLTQLLEMRDEIETRSRLILKSLPLDPSANELLASLELGRGDYEKTKFHLAKVVKTRPQLHILYAKVLEKCGDSERAMDEARKAVDFHQKILVRKNLSDQEISEHEISLAAGFLFMKKYEQACRVLAPAGASVPKDPVRREALGRILFAWSESIAPAGNAAALIRKFKLLEAALELAPGDPNLLTRIAQLAGTQGQAGEEAQQTLKRVLATGTAPAVVHVILGVNAFTRGDEIEAIKHWEIANSITPETPNVLNNLAVLLSRQEKPDLSRALGLVNRAIKLQPNNPEFFDSRGQIFMKLNNPKEAIASFERALSELPERKDIHLRLAEAYEKIGDAEMSALHRSFIKSSEDDLPP